MDGEVTAVGFSEPTAELVIPAAVVKDGDSYRVTAIADYAFARQGVTDLTLGANVAIIDILSFAGNQIESITIPNSVTTIGGSAFSNNLVTTVTIPSSVRTLQNYAESEYSLILRSTPVTLASGTIGALGAFTATGVFPSGLSAGAHTVTFTGTDASGSPVTRVAYFSVNAAGVVTYLSYTAAEAVASALPQTGVDSAPLGLAALLLLVAGGALMVGRRRGVARGIRLYGGRASARREGGGRAHKASHGEAVQNCGSWGMFGPAWP